MKNFNKKQFILRIVSIFVSILLVIIGALYFKYEPIETTDSELEKATVTKVIAETLETGLNNTEVKTVIFEAEITSGEFKGKTFKMTQMLDEMTPPVPRKVEKGDRILVAYDSEGEHLASVSGWNYAGVNNIRGVIILIGSFLALVLIIGRVKGILTIVSLVITVASIFFIYIPAMLMGNDIYILTVSVTLFIILSSLIILNGYNKKTICAIIGNAGGVLVSGVLALIINNIFGITGIVDQDYLFLTMLEGGVSINLKALVWGGILIGSLGAVMDVAMSLASSMQELANEMENPSIKRLVHSGFNIGKDAIGTMANTLILAYVGSSLATILLFAAYNSSFTVLLNFEMIMVEIIQAVVGSLGILLAVPITVFSSAFIMLKHKKEDGKAVLNEEN